MNIRAMHGRQREEPMQNPGVGCAFVWQVDLFIEQSELRER